MSRDVDLPAPDVVDCDWTDAGPATWGPGPWEGEPDTAQWTEANTGLECRAERGLWGAWCGYVGVPSTHPLHGMDREDECITRLNVQNEVTFTGLDTEGTWWIGFHCGYIGVKDIVPGCPPYIRELSRALGASYKTLDHVKGRCTALALQLAP